jgi:hypothetical protein
MIEKEPVIKGLLESGLDKRFNFLFNERERQVLNKNFTSSFKIMLLSPLIGIMGVYFGIVPLYILQNKYFVFLTLIPLNNNSSLKRILWFSILDCTFPCSSNDERNPSPRILL